ncbi:hypothetical protein GCK72_002487 [Caenorhabditis remanei]|uniref:Integrator complex subunit 1 R4 domain-containing protein n=2 Tax=Caenorhabditis remanei TaxID=31234 RepID=E3LVQ9_CAERE|nr:hypothetical protein GCK72_002487 [Caenorhabditis remanei]EFP12337.1 hypothetical protein CRE_29569 [Caenorhabditis remanei]KAF1770666.1 hypothetical protein GCK72_002487 [Caenorhabditis remanei]
MTDIDERLGRANSHPRFLPVDQQAVNDPLSKLISDYELSQAYHDRELLDLIQKVERNNPERCSKAPKFVSRLLTHKSAPIRKSAFAACITILSFPQSPRRMMLDAYRMALCNSNYQVAQYALSLLPQFVDVCPEEANNLIKCGAAAYNKLPAPSTDIEMYLSRAYTKASQ